MMEIEMTMDQTDLNILRAIASGASMREMADKFEIAIGTVKNRIDRMVEAGLLIRPAKPRQARSYRLSLAGLELIEREQPGPAEL